MSLADRIIPAEALRWGRFHPLTNDAATLRTIWEQQFYRQHPVHEPRAFLEPGPFTLHNRYSFDVAFSEGSETAAEVFAERRPRRLSLLSWRKRR